MAAVLGILLVSALLIARLLRILGAALIARLFRIHRNVLRLSFNDTTGLKQMPYQNDPPEIRARIVFMSDATHLLDALSHGDPHAAEALLPILYDELRCSPPRNWPAKSPARLLQPTALVHEAYLRLVGGKNAPRWSGRKQFFGAAAEAMRRILVDTARRKKSAKHTPDSTDAALAIEGPSDDILAVHEALDHLAQTDAAAAELVKLHYFTGFTLEEAAEALDISPRTARRRWAFARTWLFRRLSERPDV